MSLAASVALLLAATLSTPLPPPNIPDLMPFSAALERHQAGDLVVARRAFEHLALLGHTEARFNYAAMLINGDGGEKDRALGYRYAALAAADGLAPAIELATMLRQRDPEGFAAAEQDAPALDRVRAVLATKPGRAKRGETDISTDCYQKIERTPPSYPIAAAMNGVGAVVDLEFMVGADGYPVAVHVTREIPSRFGFAESALTALRSWHFERTAGCTASVSRLVSTRIEYGMGGNESISSAGRKQLKEYEQRAQQGDGAAAFDFYLLATYRGELFKKGPEASVVSGALLTAFRADIPGAARELAVRLAEDEPELSRRAY